mgnify:CR=1 FL=1
MQPFLPCNQGLFATMQWFFAIPVPWLWQGVPVMAVVSCMEVCRLKGRCRPGLVAAGVFGHAAFCGYGWPGATARRQWHRAGQCLHSGGPAVALLPRLLYWPAIRPFLHCRTARFARSWRPFCKAMSAQGASGCDSVALANGPHRSAVVGIFLHFLVIAICRNHVHRRHQAPRPWAG